MNGVSREALLGGGAYYYFSKIDIRIYAFSCYLEGTWIENITVKVGFLPF